MPSELLEDRENVKKKNTHTQKKNKKTKSIRLAAYQGWLGRTANAIEQNQG